MEGKKSFFKDNIVYLMMSKKIIVLILLFFFLFGCSSKNIQTVTNFADDINEELSELPEEFNNIEELPVNDFDSNSVTLFIANWNLQIFGQSKAGKSELMDYYVEQIDDYNIVVIQEIRDKAETAFPQLCKMLPDYKCIVSTRAGTTSSKEQYGIIYKDVELVNQFDWNTEEHFNEFERPPFQATFKRGEWEFTIITIHTKPGDVPREMTNLQALLEEKEDEEIIILGDMNLDCSYYKQEKENHFGNWIWAIPQTEDTTVSQTDCAYDRIIYTPAVENNFVEYGIMKNVKKEQSDHYLIWGEFTS